jgi:hypothetical protein
MREAGRCSGYMPLSGTASGRPLMINSVSRRGHRQILLATFSRQKTAFPQLMCPFQATCRRNLRLAGKVCIGTGTGGSMGRATALTFAREGASGSRLAAEIVEIVRAAGGEMVSLRPL